MVTTTPVSKKNFFVMVFLSRAIQESRQESRCFRPTLGAPA
jgi:hypothetical protein